MRGKGTGGQSLPDGPEEGPLLDEGKEREVFLFIACHIAIR